jgi:hypothetical protein
LRDKERELENKTEIEKEKRGKNVNFLAQKPKAKPALYCKW